MSGSGYAEFDDPYCYKGTFVLKNKVGLRPRPIGARAETYTNAPKQ